MREKRETRGKKIVFEFGNELSGVHTAGTGSRGGVWVLQPHTHAHIFCVGGTAEHTFRSVTISSAVLL